MSMKKDYEQFLENRRKIESGSLAAVFIDQEKRYVHPFRMYGNLYYVGDDWVCVHIVDTGNGLLMFDAGNAGAAPLGMLINAIWEIGLKPSEVKWIVLSHGHVDHIGAAVFFRNMFGSKIYLGAPDAENFRNKPELALLQDCGDCMEKLFEPDGEIHEGDKIDFGGTEVEFHLVPGHTEGVISCFFNVSDGKNVKRVGYYGGFGFNTLTEEYLNEIGDSELKMREVYLQSIQSVINEPVDIFMPNHCENVDLVNKRAYLLEHPDDNPFVDPDAWKAYLDKKYHELLKFMGRE